MGRFPTALLRQKAHQLLLDCARICCVAGKRRAGEDNRSCGLTINWRCMQMWRCEYGLCMRAPTRKYNVPKHVLEELLVILVDELGLCANIV